MATGYPYKSLNHERQEIRVLEFSDTFPTDGSQMLSCRMRTISLLNFHPKRLYDNFSRKVKRALATAKPHIPRPYTAISYTWGDTSHHCNIKIDGIEVLVPRNAELALRYLHSQRPCSKPNRLWIDSVCIDQSNSVERGRQVAIMGDVYFKAHQVLVWLGEDDGTTERALKSLNLVMAQASSETDGLRDFHKSVFIIRYGGYVAQYIDSDLPSKLDPLALKSFFGSAWFSRLWVLQEAALGKNVFCYRGEYCLPWMTVLMSAMWLIHRRYESAADFGSPIEFFRNCDLMYLLRRPIEGCGYSHREDCRAGFCLTGFRIGGLLSSGSSLRASDPLDVVYAVRGLLTEDFNSKIVPDYKTPLSLLLTQVARLAIRESGALSVLGLYRMPLEWYEKEGWPSWVPCWHMRGVITSAPTIFSGSYNCTNALEIDLADERPDSSPFRLRGIIIDEVVFVSSMTPDRDEPWTNGDVVKLVEWHANGLSAAGSLQLNELTVKTLCITLCAGLDKDSQELKPSTITVDPNPDQGQMDRGHGFLCRIDESLFEIRSETRLDDLFGGMVSVAPKRCLFTTRSGYIGLGPSEMSVNDKACILFGGQRPFILREQDDHWIMLGEAYVHGVMHGELVRELKDSGQLRARTQLFDVR